MSLYYEVRVIRYRLDYFGGSISFSGLFFLWVQLKERRKPKKRRITYRYLIVIVCCNTDNLKKEITGQDMFIR